METGGDLVLNRTHACCSLAECCRGKSPGGLAGMHSGALSKTWLLTTLLQLQKWCSALKHKTSCFHYGWLLCKVLLLFYTVVWQHRESELEGCDLSPLPFAGSSPGSQAAAGDTAALCACGCEERSWLRCWSLLLPGLSLYLNCYCWIPLQRSKKLQKI